MNSKKEIYLAIIGNIIDSRKIDNRNDVQKLQSNPKNIL